MHDVITVFDVYWGRDTSCRKKSDPRQEALRTGERAREIEAHLAAGEKLNENELFVRVDLDRGDGCSGGADALEGAKDASGGE